MSERQADGSSEAERETKRILDGLMNQADPQLWAQAFMVAFGRKRQDIDEGLMLAWFSCAMQATHSRGGVKGEFEMGVRAELPQPQYLTPLSGELHQRIILESARLEGMASMLRIIGTGLDAQKLAQEMEGLAKRLRGEPEEGILPSDAMREVVRQSGIVSVTED